jgi:hypothetical protein
MQGGAPEGSAPQCRAGTTSCSGRLRVHLCELAKVLAVTLFCRRKASRANTRRANRPLFRPTNHVALGRPSKCNCVLCTGIGGVVADTVPGVTLSVVGFIAAVPAYCWCAGRSAPSENRNCVSLWALLWAFCDGAPANPRSLHSIKRAFFQLPMTCGHAKRRPNECDERVSLCRTLLSPSALFGPICWRQPHRHEARDPNAKHSLARHLCQGDRRPLPAAEHNVSCICQTGAPAGRLGLPPPPSTRFPCRNDQFRSTDAWDKCQLKLRIAC